MAAILSLSRIVFGIALVSGILSGQTAVEGLDDRVRQAINQLAQRFEGGPVAGRFTEPIPGSYTFVPDDRSLAIAVIANPDKVGALAVGPVINLRGQVDRALRRITVKEYKLADIGGAAALPANPVKPTDVALSARARIQARFDEFMQPGAMNVDLDYLSPSTATGRSTLNSLKSFGQAYAEARKNNDEAATAEVVNQWIATRGLIASTRQNAPQLKSMYGQMDNYAPWRYDRINSDSAAVVAIGEPGQGQARCSGVLIGPDLVLTAAHCFSDPPTKPPGELEVWFSYVEKPDGSRGAPVRRRILPNPVLPPANQLSLMLTGGFSSSLYDYAIVRFAGGIGEPLIPGVEVAPQRTVKPQAACLRNTNPDRGAPLYAIGYPDGQSAMVHDNGRLEFPFCVLAGNEFDMLRLDVDADFRNKPDYKTVMDQFDRSYVLVPGNPFSLRCFFDVRDGGQPRMGIRADTKHGNSGGPVYDHQGDQCVVGILISGMPDTGESLRPDWNVNERVLPIKAILDDLNRTPEGRALKPALILRE